MRFVAYCAGKIGAMLFNCGQLFVPVVVMCLCGGGGAVVHPLASGSLDLNVSDDQPLDLSVRCPDEGDGAWSSGTSGV